MTTTENFFLAAVLLALLAIFVFGGFLYRLTLIVAVAIMVLGFLNGFGVLPEWHNR